MDRPIVYPAALVQDTDVLITNQDIMVMGGYITQMMAGTSAAAIGLACTPTSPASMVVNVGPGAITGFTEVDPTAYGSLGTNTNPLVKMGINQTSTPFTLTAPTTSGQSINYLIEATFEEVDAVPIVLPYYNPPTQSNPYPQPYAGPNNSGVAQNTRRTQIVGLQLKAGAAATTGTQTTPAVDAGWAPLYVITINNGQTTVTASSISVAPGAPFVGGGAINAGRLLRTTIFTNVGGTLYAAVDGGAAAPYGASTFTPTGGTNKIHATLQAAGGGSAGAPATSASQVSAGGAGGAGERVSVTLTSGFSGAAIAVGTPGATATGGNGGNGGNATFGAYTAHGGAGGTIAGPSAAPTIFAAGATGGSGSPVANERRAAGRSGQGTTIISGQGIPGLGGASYGGDCAGYGDGGLGTANSNSAAAVSGVVGQGAVLIVEEYS